MAIQLNLYVEAGATFDRSLVYRNPDKTLFDFTGYTAKLQVRETISSANAAITVIPEIDVEAATLTWRFSATQTSALTKSTYIYAMELYAPDETVIRLLEGQITVSPEVVK
jgi:hypothetical protein